MNTFLWVLQWIMAAAFLISGAVKIVRSKEQLASQMGWVNDFSGNTVKLIGTAEVLGAIGLVVPALTGIAVVLTPLAAVGLVLVMIGAIATHVRRKEYQIVVANVILLLIAAVIAWGRFGPYSF
ncbi:DoxX family protein [Tenggerimyces flavus]|uniref:DoxX family protein n=1 Tax=Tenggerimyces flavus TaxID=1708749 RepID=A0ABV7Y9V1_9ACTN|nr:DoxX family protein [Tenggerimyces flavus]MBM7786613.1 putative membrane protein [Tenggerimyces flavus]